MTRQQLGYMRLALAFQHIALKEVDIEKIISTYELVTKKGGNTNLKDIAQCEINAENKYKVQSRLTFEEKD